MTLSSPMKWEGSDLGLRVFECHDVGHWVARGMGSASWSELAEDPETPWLACIDGDDDPPVGYPTARLAKIAILATMVWKNKAYQERLHAELGDEGCPF